MFAKQFKINGKVKFKHTITLWKPNSNKAKKIKFLDVLNLVRSLKFSQS